MSSATFEKKRHEAEEREAEEKEEEKSELSEKEREGYEDLGRIYSQDYYGPIVGLTLVVLFALVYFGLTVAFFAVVFLVADVACLKKVSEAVKYYKKVKKYRFNDPEGTLIARKLDLAQIYFTLVLLAFTIEESLRSILNIGLAAVEELALWIAWFTVIIWVGAAFLRRLLRWVAFQSSQKFKETHGKIMLREGRDHRRVRAF